MRASRRQFIKKTGRYTAYALAIASNLFYSSLSHAQWLKKFRRAEYQEILNTLYKDIEFIDTHKIRISRLPRVAENGAIVPITINSKLKNVTKISILVEKNPSPLSAEFHLTPAVEPHVSARLKMAETCDVIVIVQSEGKYYRKSRKVKVTKGGCG